MARNAVGKYLIDCALTAIIGVACVTHGRTADPEEAAAVERTRKQVRMLNEGMPIGALSYTVSIE